MPARTDGRGGDRESVGESTTIGRNATRGGGSHRWRRDGAGRRPDLWCGPCRPRPAASETRTHPGARRPDRTRRVDSSGVGLAVHEWGEADAPPLLLAHGGFDFAGTYDVFAPLLAAGGWRVVCWDQRGHGDSDRAALYQWEADMRDALAVLDSTTAGPVPLVGHSKGGSLTTQIAASRPDRVTAVVNIDGIPSRRPMTDVQDHDRTKLLAADLASWLDQRHRAAAAERRPGTIEELARRRARMNPRLDHEWLEYLVTVGARHDSDGWRWKIDPTLRLGGFGPVAARVVVVSPRRGVRPAAGHPRYRAGGHGVGHHRRRHPWLPPSPGPRGRDRGGGPLRPHRAPAGDRGTRPRSPGGSPTMSTSGTASGAPVILRHNRIDLALWELRPGTGRPLLLLHGLGEHTDLDVVPGRGRLARTDPRSGLHRSRRVDGSGRRRVLLRDAHGRRRLRSATSR